MRIDNRLLKDVVGLVSSRTVDCAGLGLIDSAEPDTLAFLDDARWLPQLLSNSNLTALFITESLAETLGSNAITPILCDDPRFYFYSLLNYVGRESYRKVTSRVDLTASVHPRAFVSDYNVQIGPGVQVEPNATILADVTIGEGSIIRAGAVLGSEGFEHKRTSKGILSVFHSGRVIIGSQVEIGSNACIDKGLAMRDTIVGDFTKVDNLVHISHGVHIGKGCFVIASSMIAGSVEIADDAWIGPNASVAPQVKIGEKGFISLGAVVTRNVEAGQHVSGNFAIDHQRFLAFLRSIR